MTPKLANISVTCPFVTFLVSLETHTLEDLGLGDLFLGLGEAEADRDFCDRLYRSLECELELELSLEEGLGDLLLLRLLLRLLLLGFAGSSAVVCAGSWGAGAVALSVDSLGTAVAGAEVSILISGEGFAGGGSAERTGLFAFFAVVAVAVVAGLAGGGGGAEEEVCCCGCLGRASLFLEEVFLL